MKKLLLLVSLLAGMSAGAQAAFFDFSGTITYHNDVDFVSFGLVNDATDVRIWTDSFQDGVNFDPITALWLADGTLIAQNDDNPYIGPGQTYWDSGIALPFLAAGDYLFSVAAYDNFARGPMLSDGFIHDGEVGIPIEDWWVGGTGYWHLNLDGVDTASPVPEPATIGLLGLGLLSAGLMGARRRNRKV